MNQGLIMFLLQLPHTRVHLEVNRDHLTQKQHIWTAFLLAYRATPVSLLGLMWWVVREHGGWRMGGDVGVLFRLICLVIFSLQCGQKWTSNRRQMVPPLTSFSGRDWKHLIEFKFKCFKASCCLAVTSVVFCSFLLALSLSVYILSPILAAMLTLSSFFLFLIYPLLSCCALQSLLCSP